MTNPSHTLAGVIRALAPSGSATARAKCLVPRPAHWIPVLLIPIVTACTAPPVNDLGDGRHHLAVRAEHGEEGLDIDRANAAQLAEKYCRKHGQTASIQSYDAKGPFLASPAVGVIFTCVQPSAEAIPHQNLP